MKLIGIDVGTSSTKAIAIDELGNIVSQATSSYPLHEPNPGWFEQDPNDWWNAVQQCLIEVDAKSSDAIGLTGQMHGSVFLDSAGKVIRPALLWNDSRTVGECGEIEARVGAQRYREITFNQPVTGLQLPKILWLQEHEPDSFGSVNRVLLPKDFIAYRMTQSMQSDPHDASGTGCFNLTSRTWSEEILSAVGIRAEIFPNVTESKQSSGNWESIPIFLAGGDQGANGVGTGIVDSNTIGLALGSSGVTFATLDQPQFHSSGTLNCFCNVPGGYHAMAVTQNCGTALLEASRTYFGGISSSELSRLASSHDSDSDLMFAPMFGGERCPINYPNPVPVFEGRSQDDTPAELARAVFEGISFMLRYGFDQLLEICPAPSRIAVSGGGSESKFWVQMLADLFQLPISVLQTSEGPAFGAALTAGVGLGAWESFSEAARVIRIATVIEPTANLLLQEKYLKWRKWMDTAPFVKE